MSLVSKLLASLLALLMSPDSKLQVSLEGCDSWKDLLLTGQDQDQAYGAQYYQERNDRSGPESVQRIRNDHKVRNYGWCTCSR